MTPVEKHQPGSRQPAAASDHKSAVFAGYLGWTLDAFDYFLVVFCLTAIGRDFHVSDAAMALSLTVTLALLIATAYLAYWGIIGLRTWA